MVNKSEKLKNVKKVLILRTDHIGEVLLSTVVVDAIKKHYPQAHITFATSSLARSVVEAKKGIDEILVFETLDVRNLWPRLYGWYRQIAFKGYDLAILLNSNKFLHLVVFLAGIKSRIGFDRKWPFLLTQKIPDKRAEGLKHEVEYNLELLETIGIKESGIKPLLKVSEFEEKNVKELLSERSINLKKKIIVVQPGSSFIQKRWPKEHFVELIGLLLDHYDVNIVLSGSCDEFELCDDIVTQFEKNVYNFAGKFNLKQLISLLSIADILIANDSGPMHIAAALDRQIIAIFGRGTKGTGPNRWGPLGNKSIVFHRPLDCSDCYNEKCPYDFRCLKSIRPQEIFDTIVSNKLLN
ncbi:MAG: lipopolysaccharide heptosyltransferase II [Candidatus Omnitrophica bacterium]|nr:lipopolysaccharide heptosyltransferase II [Candidatus Omnitrophota bacterium]MBU1996209.1 lipopolysaccharide heptosyltransferase II [Candidatus Omnitrophota bacterium]MBU4333609.1 lipopolysaccharide heptosyltransferase II [Candidatus Omnitrophota bacterium]